MDEIFARALEAFRADSDAQERGQGRIDLPRGHFANVSRREGFDYVHLYDLRGQPVGAKRFHIQVVNAITNTQY